MNNLTMDRALATNARPLRRFRGSRAALTSGAVAVALREGLLDVPGDEALARLLPAPALRLEALLTELLALPRRRCRGLDEPRVLPAGAARRAGAALTAVLTEPSLSQRRAADAALRRLQDQLAGGGSGDCLAIALLYQLRLHLQLQCGPAPALAAEAQRWGEATLRAWRAWSDARFGPVHCVDWAPGQRYCKALGYRFAGRTHTLRHLIERLEHQEREWDRLRRRLLAPLTRSIEVWGCLAQAQKTAERRIA